MLCRIFTVFLIPIFLNPLFSQETEENQVGVGIGTSTLAPGSAFQIESTTGAMVQPRMTSSEMNAIPTPLDGAFIFNTTENAWYIHKEGSWQTFVRVQTPSIILNRGQTNNAIIITDTTNITPFPLNQDNTLVSDIDFYEATENNGEIRILRSGTYLISAGFSTTNLPPGSLTYRLEVSLNNTTSSIITNGEVNLPGSDYWGTSGNILLILQTNDLINIGYILKGASASTRTAAFFNIGVSKL